MSENLRLFIDSLQDSDAGQTSATDSGLAGQNTASPLSSGNKINVEFISGYSESRQWVIWDTKIDPNNPKVVWNDYLAPDESTGPLQIYDDGWGGEIAYQRSDGARQTGNTVRDGDKFRMTN